MRCASFARTSLSRTDALACNSRSKAACLSASDLTHRITIQAITEASDGAGGFTASWADFTQAWCSIRPLKGYERFQAGQKETPVTHKIKMRYQAGITTKHRILYGTRVFNIKEILNVEERNITLEILALEGQDG